MRNAINCVVAALLVITVPAMVMAQEYIPIKKGDPSPIDGFVITEAKATKLAEEKIEFKELKLTFEIDKKAWDFKEQQYLKGFELKDAEILRLNNEMSAWYRLPEIWMVVGAAAAIGIAKGMEELFKK